MNSSTTYYNGCGVQIRNMPFNLANNQGYMDFIDGFKLGKCWNIFRRNLACWEDDKGCEGEEKENFVS